MELPSKWKFWIPDRRKNADALKSLDRIYNRIILKFRVNAEDLNIEKIRSNLRYYDLRRHFKPLSKVKEISEGIDQLITDNIHDLDNEIKGLGPSHHIVESRDKQPKNSGLVGSFREIYAFWTVELLNIECSHFYHFSFGG